MNSNAHRTVVRLRLLIGLIGALMLAATANLAAQEAGLIDRWNETLRYGIDSEIETVLSQIEQSGETGLDAEIVARFAQTRTDALREAIIEHFTARESPVLAEEARALLLSDALLSDDFLRASVSYLSRVVEDRSEELLFRYAEIAEDRNLLAATVAIDAIGRNASDTAVAILIELFETVSSTDLKAAVIRALGEAGSEEALPMLTSVAADTFEQSSLRQYAAESLGKIGAEESLPLLTELLGSEDSVLRAYATNALGYFENDEAAELLEQALLDSFWRVRVAALEALAEQARPEALPAVAYKARRDPERPVREAAIRTLASLETTESVDVLREIALDERASEAERILAVNELSDLDPGGHADLFEEIVADEWSRENSRLLDAVGRKVSENPARELAPLYAKLLSHPNFIVRIYGIRGIGGAGLSNGSDDLKKIARENPPGLVRRTAIASLELLGISYDPEEEGERPDEAPSPESENTPEPDETPGATQPPADAETPVPEAGSGFPDDEGI